MVSVVFPLTKMSWGAAPPPHRKHQWRRETRKGRKTMKACDPGGEGCEQLARSGWGTPGGSLPSAGHGSWALVPHGLLRPAAAGGGEWGR